jgi:hypothetical protein
MGSSLQVSSSKDPIVLHETDEPHSVPLPGCQHAVTPVLVNSRHCGCSAATTPTAIYVFVFPSVV